MSKKIIAGAGVLAGLAVALAPVASFAAVNHADILRVTVPEVCTLGTVTNGVADTASDSTDHTTTNGAWDDGDPGTTTGYVAASGNNGRTDVLTHNLAPGMSATLGTTVFTVKCNDTDGYTISAVSNTNSGGQTPAATLVNGNFSILSQTEVTDADLATDGKSYWNFSVAVSNEYDSSENAKGQEIATDFDDDHVIPTTAATIVTGHGAQSIQNGETITVTYKAGIDTFQEAGTYEGKVTYTLAQL